MPKRLRPPFKSFGGKFYLSPWIIEQFPPNYEHMDYLEPFCSGSSVFFNKIPSKQSTLADTNLGVIRILQALKDRSKDFIARLKEIPYTENTFLNAQQQSVLDDEFEGAINEFILRRMSRSGLKKAFAWSERKRGGMPGDVNAWKTILTTLPTLSVRLQTAHIFHQDALELIEQYNNPNVLLYADPPYLHDTRISKNAYNEDEMSTEKHIELAHKLQKFQGKVIISGYSSGLYDDIYATWRTLEKEIVNHASQSKTKSLKIEKLWLNY